MVRIDQGEIYDSIKLDIKDKKILDILSEDSRTPISQIAKKVMVSRDIVSYKIKRFQNQGLITKFYTRIDYKKLNYEVYHVFFMVDNSKGVKDLVDTLKMDSRTYSVFEYSDHWDLEWIILVKNVQELDEIVTDIQAKFSKTILERSTMLEINVYRSIIFSYHFNKNITNLRKFEELNFKPDLKDLKIISELSKDSKKSTYEIAPQIGLSADAVGIRLKKLYKTGIIRKYTIEPNFSKLNYTWHTVCISMKHFDRREENKFKNFIENQPGVIRAAKTFGEWDVLLYITTQTPKEFHNIIKAIKLEFSHILKSYNSFVAYKEHVFNPFPKIIIEDFEKEQNLLKK
ncbi:MAG: AsnC family transcriptional regulator [Nanoarchaeales archaeon]|nr:AsnC family transcriptional regulator [Nanoarchaeales archaeon]